MKKHLVFSIFTTLVLSSGVAYAQVETEPADTAPAAKDLATDKNGDGKITRDEVTPGSSMAKRFDERDKNRDGALTQDEYFMPPGTGGNVSGKNNPPTGHTEPGSADAAGKHAGDKAKMSKSGSGGPSGGGGSGAAGNSSGGASGTSGGGGSGGGGS